MYCKLNDSASLRSPLVALALDQVRFGVPFVIAWRLSDYFKVTNSMTSPPPAVVDPGPSPDALGGVEERPTTHGVGTEPRSCSDVLDALLCPSCDG